MNNHITVDEMKRYLKAVMSGTENECDSDFINEIEDHIAVCEECCELMKTARLMLCGFSSNKAAARRFTAAYNPIPTAKPVPDLRKVFMGIRLVVTDKMQVLADTLGERMRAAFIPEECAYARSGEHEISDEAINNLLHSSMEITLEDDRKITLRCREIGGEKVLFIYAGFDAAFTLTCGERTVEPESRLYDDMLKEYIVSYKIGDDSFILTAQ